jgi:hypothetical protein
MNSEYAAIGYPPALANHGQPAASSRQPDCGAAPKASAALDPMHALRPALGAEAATRTVGKAAGRAMGAGGQGGHRDL